MGYLGLAADLLAVGTLIGAVVFTPMRDMLGLPDGVGRLVLAATLVLAVWAGVAVGKAPAEVEAWFAVGFLSVWFVERMVVFVRHLRAALVLECAEGGKR